MASRVAKLGEKFMEFYIELYDLGSWNIHAGPLDWKMIKDEKFARSMRGYGYSYTNLMFIECCKICLDQFSIEFDASTDQYLEDLVNRMQNGE